LVQQEQRRSSFFFGSWSGTTRVEKEKLSPSPSHLSVQPCNREERKKLFLLSRVSLVEKEKEKEKKSKKKEERKR
jgi:hypothetical protein